MVAVAAVTTSARLYLATCSWQVRHRRPLRPGSIPWLTVSISKLWRAASDWSVVAGWADRVGSWGGRGASAVFCAACDFCSLYCSAALCSLGTPGLVRLSQSLVFCFLTEASYSNVLRRVNSFFSYSWCLLFALLQNKCSFSLHTFLFLNRSVSFFL